MKTQLITAAMVAAISMNAAVIEPVAKPQRMSTLSVPQMPQIPQMPDLPDVVPGVGFDKNNRNPHHNGPVIPEPRAWAASAALLVLVSLGRYRQQRKH